MGGDPRSGRGLNDRKGAIKVALALFGVPGETCDLGKGEEIVAFVAHDGFREDRPEAIRFFEAARLPHFGEEVGRDRFANGKIEKRAIKDRWVVERIEGIVFEEEERGHARIEGSRVLRLTGSADGLDPG